MLTSSSTVQSTIPALQRTTPTAQALMLIKFPPFSFDLQSFLTRLTYSAVILPFILVLRVWSNSKMLKISVTHFPNFADVLVIG